MSIDFKLQDKCNEQVGSFYISHRFEPMQDVIHDFREEVPHCRFGFCLEVLKPTAIKVMTL